MTVDLHSAVRTAVDEARRLATETFSLDWEVGPTFGARDNRVYVREEGDHIDSIGTCVIAGQVSNTPTFRANAAHIAYWDPRRALAMCDWADDVLRRHTLAMDKEGCVGCGVMGRGEWRYHHPCIELAAVAAAFGVETGETDA